MFSRKEIEVTVNQYTNIGGLKHISDMLEEIQACLFHDALGKNSGWGDRFAKHRRSKFVELCVDENWNYASGVADSMNKEILTKTPLFQNFIRSVKTLPDYISITRENKLKNILDNE